MSVAHAFKTSTWERLLDTWRELDVPEGYRPEITADGIVMTPPPQGSHNKIADLVHRALVACAPAELAIYQTQGIGVEAAESICIPDLCVAPRAETPDGVDPMRPDKVLLAVEITSPSNAAADRARKKSAYAIGGIGQYLLIDPVDADGPSVTLFSAPAKGAYRRAVRVPFGETIRLGAPFELALDTSGFPVGDTR